MFLGISRQADSVSLNRDAGKRNKNTKLKVYLSGIMMKNWHVEEKRGT